LISGRKDKNKKLVVVGIEKKDKGVSQLYARVILRSDLGLVERFHEGSRRPRGPGVTNRRDTGHWKRIPEPQNEHGSFL